VVELRVCLGGESEFRGTRVAMDFDSIVTKVLETTLTTNQAIQYGGILAMAVVPIVIGCHRSLSNKVVHDEHERRLSHPHLCLLEPQVSASARLHRHHQLSRASRKFARAYPTTCLARSRRLKP